MVLGWLYGLQRWHEPVEAAETHAGCCGGGLKIFNCEPAAAAVNHRVEEAVDVPRWWRQSTAGEAVAAVRSSGGSGPALPLLLP